MMLSEVGVAPQPDLLPVAFGHEVPSTSNLMPTMTALNHALSLMPTTSSTVMAVTMNTAGK